MPPELVIWDFDGTLADTFAAIRFSVDEALASVDRAPCDTTVLRSSIGLSLSTVFGRLAPDADADEVARCIATYRSVFVQDSVRLISLFPGIDDVLTGLRDAGVPGAIATSKARIGVESALDHLGLSGHFDLVVTDDDVTDRKPHPAMVHLIGERLGVPVGSSIVVGDTAFDIEMGRRAGATTCGVTWGNHSRADLDGAGATFVVDTVAGLAGVLSGCRPAGATTARVDHRPGPASGRG